MESEGAVIEKIINWIRTRLKSMFNKNSIQNAARVKVAMSDSMVEAVKLWNAMYENKSPWLTDDVKSLGLASTISSEIAMLVTIESEFEITGSARAEFISAQFDKVFSDIRTSTEYGCKGGGLVFKPYITKDEELKCEYVHSDNFFPLDDELKSAVFTETVVIDNTSYVRLEIHRAEGNILHIRNEAYRADNMNPVSLSSIPEWADLESEVFIRNVNRPLFTYFKIPFANNIDPRSPLGVSVYSRATDLIKDADEQYSRLLWEFEGGALAVDVDTTAFAGTLDGKPSKIPKLEKRLFRRHAYDGGGGETFYNVFSPALRDNSYVNGLNTILRKIEDTCGLSHGTFSDIQGEAKTATEIKIQKQRSYATISDIQKALEKALRDLIEVYDIYCDLYDLAPAGEYEASFKWDDSIIVDASQEQTIMLSEVQANILNKVQYLMKRYGVTEEVAREMMPEQTSTAGLFEGF
jgi:A118 family predicted phage portal protein